MFIKIINKILNVIFPLKCCICNSTEGNEIICKSCLAVINEKALDSESRTLKYPYITAAASPYIYSHELLKRAISKLKHSNSRALTEFFADKIVYVLKSRGITADAVTYAPRRGGAVKKYGYDQAKTLAKFIAQKLGLPCVPLIKRHGRSKEQKGLNSKARHENVKDIFSVPDKIVYKRIVIVDDIITTGATIAECARILREHGASEIYAAAAARSPLCGRF